MKKFIVSIIVGVFYVVYIVYDRSHAPKLAGLTLPTQNLSNFQQTVSTSSAGSASPSFLATAIVAQASPSAPAQQTQKSTANAAPTPANPPAANSSSQTSNPASQPTSSNTQLTPPTPAPAPTPPPAPAAPQGQYKDGQYTGSSVDAYYGLVQVKAIVSGGKITDVQFLSYPSDRSTSQQINSQAMPYLTQEAILAQSANVDIISGATDTSQAFIQSLGTALAQAKV